MPTAPQKFSQELILLGAVALSFLMQMLVQYVWNQTDKGREAVADLQRSVVQLASKVEATQRQLEEQSVFLRKAVEGGEQRESRIVRLELAMQHTEKSLEDANGVMVRQFQRLETQIADLHRAILQRTR